MESVRKVFSKVLNEWVDLYEINGRWVPCFCEETMKCWFHNTKEEQVAKNTRPIMRPLL